MDARHIGRKSLRWLTGKSLNFEELARDCVSLANGGGGALVIGFEDGEEDPPPHQHIERGLLDRIRQRIGELTVGVQALPELQRHENGGEYILLSVPPSAGVATLVADR